MAPGESAKAKEVGQRERNSGRIREEMSSGGGQHGLLSTARVGAKKEGAKFSAKKEIRK